MTFYLGIDGGGTKTRCVLGNETRVLATATTGPSNIVRVGAERARGAIHECILKVTETARISAGHIQYVCVGAAGGAREDVATQLRSILRDITPAQVEIAGDTVIALETAFDTGPGIIAISGTGSIVYGRNASGATARAGGWGYAIGDEGSAQWIGRRAVWSVFRAVDAGTETCLASLILKAWNLSTTDDLVQRANAVPPPEFPSLFPIVLRAAADGDVTSNRLLEQAGDELAAQAAIVVRRLFVPDDDRAGAPCSADPSVDGPIPLAMTGSVFRQSSRVRVAFCHRIRAEFPRVALLGDIIEPVHGALARARKMQLETF